MKNILCTTVLFLLATISLNAQQIVGQVLDLANKESLPYVTIRVGDIDLVSNEEGKFSFDADSFSADSKISASFIGFSTYDASLKDFLAGDKIIWLEEKGYELSSVYVSNVKPNPLDIIKKVKQNLIQNYDVGDKAIKQRYFTRSNDNFKPKKVSIDLDKATRFTKAERKILDQELKKTLNEMLKNPPKEFNDRMLTLYRVKGTDKSKIVVEKAVKLYDENNSSDIKNLEKRATSMFSKLLDTTKFYRFKSGWFGSNDTISFSKKYNQEKAKRNKSKKAKLLSINEEELPDEKIKNELIGVVLDLKDNNFLNGSKLDFVLDYEAYHFNFIDVSYLADEMVYVLDFKPRKSRANFEGRLYINDTDFAIVRADYRLAEGKTLDGINLKLLLGVKFRQNKLSGTVIFKKNKELNMYVQQYFSQESGMYFYVHRPISFIELAKVDKDKISFDFKIEGEMNHKKEYLNVSDQATNIDVINGVTSKGSNYIKINKYDPSIWKGFNSIEPLSEMKKFEVVE